MKENQSNDLSVREYGEVYPVTIVRHTNGRLCIRAVNEGGNNEVLLDAGDLLKALEMPSLVSAAISMPYVEGITRAE